MEGKINFYYNYTPTSGDIKFEYSPLHNLYSKLENRIGEMNTNVLNFSLNNPVSMSPQFSYDGSVDLILTDDLNEPKLINSRFKILENDQYEVPYHLNEVPTNIYDVSSFKLSGNLQKIYNSIPVIELQSVTNDGYLKVGNYVFYIKYSDSDENTTDVCAESGIISCFIGYNKQPKNIQGGYRDLNSYKSIILKLSNLDTNYNFLQIYYSRDTSDIDQNRVSEFYKIDKLYKYDKSTNYILIFGDEEILSVSEIELNTYLKIINKAKAQAICLNQLFLGNIEEDTDNIAELEDISLRFLPFVIPHEKNNLIGNVSGLDYYDNSSCDSDSTYEYYNTNNIYNKVGYWNEEIYRFGIVYIYGNGRLSNVYNVRGINSLPIQSDVEKTYSKYNIYIDENHTGRFYIPYDKQTNYIKESKLENNLGVVRLNQSDSSSLTLYSIGFKTQQGVWNLLNDLNIIGFFFVRLKRIPTILAQAVLLPESKLGTHGSGRFPMLPLSKYDDNVIKYAMERFINNSGTLVQDYTARLYYGNREKEMYSAVCPEYIMNLPFYNALFTGNKLLIKCVAKSIFDADDRHYYLTNIESYIGPEKEVNILSIPDNTKTMAIDSKIVKGIAGTGEEAFRVNFINNKSTTSYKKFDELKYDARKLSQSGSNLLRGIWGPHLVIDNLVSTDYGIGDLINIYIPGYSSDKMEDYYKIRFEDDSEFYSISNRYQINNIYRGPFDEIDDIYTLGTISKSSDNIYDLIDVYRGDCFTCTYTWRMNRNFQDASTPTNDIIVDDQSWRKYWNTDSAHVEALNNINRSDVNAVNIGSWITVKVCASSNLGMRAEDKSHSDEKGLNGIFRSFYPLGGFNYGGNNKIPESDVMNKGFGSTVGHLKFNHLNNIIYINNKFSNRIVYSKENATAEYINSLRCFPAGNYRDYNIEHGGITKLIAEDNGIYCIFEYGIGFAPIRERVQTAGQGGGAVYLNANNVLPQELIFISNDFGSKFLESVIKTPSGRIYGVDTVAKKIWMISGLQFKIISDLVIGEFLNTNIPFKEHDSNILIGTKNVKTHYNASKGDVMFTLYRPSDDDSKYEDVWNICYNDISQSWVSFYSWVPLESNNVTNVMYSIDRNYARMLNEYSEYKLNEFNGELE